MNLTKLMIGNLINGNQTKQSQTVAYNFETQVSNTNTTVKMNHPIYHPETFRVFIYVQLLIATVISN